MYIQEIQWQQTTMVEENDVNWVQIRSSLFIK
jgi:hypothetical protein